MTKIIFPTDQHFPFQDDNAIAVAMKIAEDFNPDVRISGSDGIDFYSISRFDKNPERIKVGLQGEINQWKAGERAWNDATMGAQAFYLIGNHEDRLRRYLWNHSEIYGLDALELPNLLGMSELQIDFSSPQEYALDGLLVKHGEVVRMHSGFTAKAELEREYFSIPVLLTGHTHRGGSFMITSRTGIHRAYECFCLCKLDVDYVTNPNWQQGLTLAEVRDGMVSVEQIPFHDHITHTSAIWRGKEYIS